MSIFYKAAQKSLQELPKEKFEVSSEFFTTPQERKSIKEGKFIGKKFGALTLIKALNPTNPYYFEFHCECGRKQNLPFSSVKKAGNNARCAVCLGRKIEMGGLTLEERKAKYHYSRILEGQSTVLCNKKFKVFGVPNAKQCYNVLPSNDYNCKQCLKVAKNMLELGYNWQSVVDKYDEKLVEKLKEV